MTSIATLSSNAVKTAVLPFPKLCRLYVCNAESEGWLPFYLTLDAVNSYSRLQPYFFVDTESKN
jgi:hypothetical protein